MSDEKSCGCGGGGSVPPTPEQEVQLLKALLAIGGKNIDGMMAKNLDANAGDLCQALAATKQQLKALILPALQTAEAGLSVQGDPVFCFNQYYACLDKGTDPAVCERQLDVCLNS
jgi:hypothetical protein